METRPAIRTLQTLPSVTPFRAPVRGEMITNGSNGTYFIGHHIGSGSFGDVYECTDEWANALVAKVLKPALPFDEVRRQWEEEVGNLMRMRHPNITYIYDAFIYDNAFYIIVEKCWYSLDRILHRLDESWLPHIARDILQALGFIHRFGYVHKDVHPGNVFVSLSSDAMSSDKGPYPTFKLGDLGIARMEGEIRTAGTILAPWMKPPEAIDPHHYGNIGRTTDVYHTALLLLAVLYRDVTTFTEPDIVAGLPMRMAEQTGSIFTRALSNALQPHVLRRTQTPLEFWREIQAALTYASTHTGGSGTNPPLSRGT